MRHVYLRHLVRATKFAVVLAVAVLVGLAATTACALLGSEVLVLIYGEDLSVIDDTLPMITAVFGMSLIVLGLAGGACFALLLDVVEPIGWWRLLAVPPALIVGGSSTPSPGWALAAAVALL